MKKPLQQVLYALSGALCAGAAMYLSGLLMRRIGSVVGAFGGLIGEETVNIVVPVLGQLRGAKIGMPVWGLLPAGAALGWALMHNGKRIILKAVLIAVVFMPVCFYFMQINGIRLTTALRVIMNLAGAGLF